jgi:hypothetical protein
MLQRVQSIWLLLVSLFSSVTFRFPFYNGDWERDTQPAPVDLNATSTIWFTVITVVLAILAFITIFLFANRKLQLKLCYLGIGISILLLSLYFLEMISFYHPGKGTIALWCIFYFAILVSYILAARGILKDEKLIKSMDRLR